VESFAGGIGDGLAKYHCGPHGHDFSGSPMSVGDLRVRMCVRCPRLEVGDQTCSFCDNAPQTSAWISDDAAGLEGPGQLCDACLHAIESSAPAAHGWKLSGAHKMMAG